MRESVSESEIFGEFGKIKVKTLSTTWLKSTYINKITYYLD